MEDTRDDATLMRAHVDGDPTAFAELVRRHRDRMWAVALRTTRDPEEAADAVQEALISAFRKADQFQGDAAVTTWLHRIVVNACLDRMRRSKVRPTVPLPEESPDEFGGAPAGALTDQVDHIDRAETAMEIKRALDELPEDQRAAIMLVDVEGYPVEEAAEMLACPVGTVKSRCFRGRKKLAERLGHLRNPDVQSDVIDPQRDNRSGTGGPRTGKGGA